MTTQHKHNFRSLPRLPRPLLAFALVLFGMLSAVGGTAMVLHAAKAQNTALPAPVSCASCWHPALKTSWQWQLSGTVDTSFNVQMYDIDMFNNNASVVQSLHNAHRIVICYIDAGTWENWRPDASQFPNSVKGNAVSKGDGQGNWDGENWLDIRQLSILKPLMQARVSQCKAKGFDGVEFDNVDGFDGNDTGFNLSAKDQLAYNTFLANEAHSQGLSVALKNDPAQVTQLLPYFDWELDEECFSNDECDSFQPFIKANKPVMEVEYNLTKSQFCPQANSMNFNAMKKGLDLDAPRDACR